MHIQYHNCDFIWFKNVSWWDACWVFIFIPNIYHSIFAHFSLKFQQNVQIKKPYCWYRLVIFTNTIVVRIKFCRHKQQTLFCFVFLYWNNFLWMSAHIIESLFLDNFLLWKTWIQSLILLHSCNIIYWIFLSILQIFLIFKVRLCLIKMEPMRRVHLNIHCVTPDMYHSSPAKIAHIPTRYIFLIEFWTLLCSGQLTKPNHIDSKKKNIIACRSTWHASSNNIWCWYVIGIFHRKIIRLIRGSSHIRESKMTNVRDKTFVECTHFVMLQIYSKRIQWITSNLYFWNQSNSVTRYIQKAGNH